MRKAFPIANFLCLLSWSLFFGSHSQAQTVADLATGKWSFRNGTIPLYIGDVPSAVVHVDKGHNGIQRRGFFRIGVLPLGVLEGVTFEILNPSLATNTLAQLHHWIDPKDATGVELRRVTLRVAGTETNSIQSAVVSVGPNGQWKMHDVDFVSGTNRIHAARATLQVIGEQTGQLVMETTPPSTNYFFSQITAVQSLSQK